MTPSTGSLLVGAGDLIGASLFNSAVADDQPTIDVMNEIGLDASARSATTSSTRAAPT